MAEGRYAEARARYEQFYPELLEDEQPQVNEDNVQPAIDLALVLIKTGEQSRADALLEQSLNVVQAASELDGYSVSKVLIFALQGKTEAALAALREAIDGGWRVSWWIYLEHDASLDTLRDEPEFQAMVEEVRGDMAEQLERVHALQASGEMEPIPDAN